ncbi:MAG: hypothetical protein EOO23_05570 [Comamonadaceae bacterium]|nr:MAG: hypothetical protein EOO23_05570 [Comamonadaceae bacterium]
MVEKVQTADGEVALARFLDQQIRRCIHLATALKDSELPRVSRLYAIFSAIIEDAISIRLLGDDARTNQAYIIARALLERVTNFCFLQLCTNAEYNDYLDYTLNKAGRSLNRSIEAGGELKARIALKDGSFELPPEIAAAVAKFTSERGREKTRWTNVSLPDRAAVIEAKLQRTGLFMSLLTIYADASEALHGTLYGAVFHLGAYSVGSVPTDQESLDRHRHATLCCLYLMTGGAIDTLISLLKTLGEPYASQAAAESKADFRKVAIEVGLAASAK